MSKLGPYDLQGWDVGKKWAAVAPVVKSQGNTAALRAAPARAYRIYRWVWDPAQQDEILRNRDSGRVVGTIMNGLAGYQHDRLYVEVLNEVGKEQRDAYIALLQDTVPMLKSLGLKVCGPGWATGDYEQADWDAFRLAHWCGLNAISLHCYWSSAGFSPWNALRYRTYWQPGDPRVFVTETGRDRVRDGPNGTYLPPGDGPFGWASASQNCSPDQYVNELVAYDVELAKDAYVIGGVVFCSSPTDDWRDAGFSVDPLVDTLISRLPQGPENGGAEGPQVIPVVPKPAGPLAPEKPPVSRPNEVSTVPPPPDVCPFALFTPLTRNFDLEGTVPKIVVAHGTAGLGDPYNWWNRMVEPTKAASADFWISKSGVVRQYVRLATQTSWSNGPLNKPDLSVPFLAWLVGHKKKNPSVTGNTWTVSVEFEKGPDNSDVLTAAQETAGRDLFQWLSETYAIPKDRTHFLEHNQFDSVTRARCPGPLPWARLLGQRVRVVQDDPRVLALRDLLWSAKDTAWTLGRQRLGDDIMTAVRRDKGEIT